MRPKLKLDELNKALLITCGVCYLLSFVLSRYAAASTLFRLLFAAAAIFLGVRLFARNPAAPHLPPVLPAAPGPPGQGQDPGHLHQMSESVRCQKLKLSVYYHSNKEKEIPQ